MTIYEMTIASVTLPYPRERDPFSMEYIPFGASRRMANGTYRVQHTGGKWRVVVHWEGLTRAEYDVLWAAYGGAIATGVAVQFPDGQTYTMMTGLGTWSEGQWYSPGDGVFFYNISFALEQV